MMPTRRWREGGFSLIELLVVLALVSLSMAIAVPRLSSDGAAVHELHVRGTAQVFREARLEAMQDGDTRFVEVDVGDRSIRSGDKFVQFGPHVALRATLAARDVQDARRARYAFFPDGSARGGALTIERRGRARTVTIDWLTGRVLLRPGPAPRGKAQSG